MARLKNIFRAFTNPGFGKRAILRRAPGVVHVGNRSHGRKLKAKGVKLFKKTYSDLDAMAREVHALELFADMPWAPPLVETGDNYIVLPFFDEKARLDFAADEADQQTRLEMARQAVAMLLDIYMAGYAHRDFHAKNLFWLDGSLYAIDYEGLCAYPDGSRPAFPESYDMTGRGMDSPHETFNMCWDCESASRMALKFVLGIDSAAALNLMDEMLRSELLEASLSFNKRGKRHICSAGKIYASFDLPYFSVGSSEVQRDVFRRWERFGLTAQQVRNAALLDLGCNAGAILFHASGFGPARCIGVEYDQAKVDIASKIAAYNGMDNISFRQGDIDRLEAESLGGPFDIVFCLAIEAHLKKPERLYGLLGELCSDTLIFEGNSITDMDAVIEKLHAAGFRTIEKLGTCDDDQLHTNNTRELIRAHK